MNPETLYPQGFLNTMKNLLGAEYSAFINSLSEPAPTSIRINPNKRITKFEHEETVPWCKEGRYLKERPSFTFDPLFHAGAYYVQEASSMFIEQVLQQINPKGEPVKVLDMCAAPGGKSTHLLSLISEESLLVSNEVIPNRNKILCQNIIKWGKANCIITQNKPEDFSVLENYFDIVVIDAPCSGEGLFRKDKDAIGEWSEKNVAMCGVRQKEIIKHAVQCLKPGGFLIYSTCTYEPGENDENMKWAKELEVAGYRLQVERFPAVQETDCGYQFFPHKTKGEGFYIAVLKKNSESRIADSASQRQKEKPQLQHTIANYLSPPEKFIEIKKGVHIFAIPKSIAADFSFLEKHFYIRNAGIFMGEIKGNDFLPSHDLALSNHIQKNFSFIELNYDEAVSYLRCEAIKIKTDIRGWCLVKYQGLNLGWLKIMEGRSNNYFLREWRILKNKDSE